MNYSGDAVVRRKDQFGSHGAAGPRQMLTSQQACASRGRAGNLLLLAPRRWVVL